MQKEKLKVCEKQLAFSRCDTEFPSDIEYQVHLKSHETSRKETPNERVGEFSENSWQNSWLRSRELEPGEVPAKYFKTPRSGHQKLQIILFSFRFYFCLEGKI